MLAEDTLYCNILWTADFIELIYRVQVNICALSDWFERGSLSIAKAAWTNACRLLRDRKQRLLRCVGQLLYGVPEFGFVRCWLIITLTAERGCDVVATPFSLRPVRCAWRRPRVLFTMMSAFVVWQSCYFLCSCTQMIFPFVISKCLKVDTWRLCTNSVSWNFHLFYKQPSLSLSALVLCFVMIVISLFWSFFINWIF